ncbi:HlyD family secretion protein [Anaerocolumna sp. MB42-C2]|uniref:HlyD family secretion protein n=1 Tax=Anaerocolumna sp. MB42-C2 TaxID=3070997 RepID=UPI0027E12375|nr:efflux RND transporter periplasmic adaptor subunit [Anaerocolumna sp. MB42-C2]WMJ88200.1 efflux RND transporter periplasmic adaptor subunit [Anaerocolumna sp. MB42-C2]
MDEFKDEMNETKKKSKKGIILIIVAIVVIVGAYFGSEYYIESTKFISTDNAKVDTKIFQITSGTSGKLTKINVAIGDSVQSGQILGRAEGGPYIKSPIDGEVMDIKADLGQLVSPSDVIFVVAGVDDMYITANIEEDDILKVAEGQEVAVSLDAYGNKSFSGYVEKVDKITSNKLSNMTTSFTTSGTYTKVTQLIPIKIKLNENINLKNIIGTNANIKIKIK